MNDDEKSAKQEKKLAEKAAKEIKRQEDLEQKARRKAAENAHQQAVKEDELRLYGRLVIEELCGNKTVRLYDKGYVRLSGMFLGKSDARFEKLMGISGDGDVFKKSGLGRVVVAGATMGANLFLTPNKRGDVYLVITTDVDTHMIHMDPPTERDMKAMKKLATTGQAILDATASLHVTPTFEAPQQNQQVPESPDLADQLMKLSQLHQAGALTDAEFHNAKSRIIGTDSQQSESQDEPDTSEPVSQLKTDVAVILINPGPKKIDAILIIRKFIATGLKETKNMVDNTPSVIVSSVERFRAEQLAEELRQIGAVVELR
jgi:ribosomal protein L7/L12